MAKSVLNIAFWQDTFANVTSPDGVLGDTRAIDPSAFSAAAKASNIYPCVRLDGSLDFVGSPGWETPEAKADWWYNMPTGTYGKAEFINVSARDHLLGRHPTQRDILIFPLLRTGVGAFEGQFKLTPANFWQYLEVGDPNTPATARLIGRYADLMHADGIEPRLVYLDYENVQTFDGGLVPGGWTESQLGAVLTHPKARFLIPSWVRQYTAAQILTRGTAGFHAWNRFARNLQARDLRQAVLRPLGRRFPRIADFKTAEVINYGFRRVTGRNAFTDQFGEPVTPALGQPPLSQHSTDYAVYSPYDGASGTFQSPPGNASDPHWAQLVNMVNLVRRTLNSGYKATLQITPPMYRGNAAEDARRNRLFFAALYQLAAHGVDRVVIWSAPIARKPNARDAANQGGTGRYDAANPALSSIITQWHADTVWFDDFANRAKTLLVDNRAARRRDWPIVPPGAAEIVTNGLTTTYADTLAAGSSTPPGDPAPGNVVP